jgi:amino acid transporter
MVIAAAAPLTVIGGNVPLAIASGNGVGAPTGFIIAALVLIVFSVGFITMTPHVKSAGAFYAYVRQSLGERLGLGTAYVALVAYTAIQVGVYGYLGGSVAAFVESLGGPSLPWWLFSGLALLVVAFLGYRNIDLSAKVLGAALILEIGIVLIVDASIFLTGGAEGISGVSFMPSSIFSGPIGVSILFALTGFMGFEATAVFRDEARNPERTIPRATFIAVGIIGAFYALSSWALIEGWGPSQVVAKATASPGTFMLDATEMYVGTAARDIMNVLLLSSLFACVLSFHNVVARYQFTLAGEGNFPARLGVVHPAHGSPAMSSVVQSVTATALVAVFSLFSIDPLVIVFGSMAGVATVGMMMLLILTSVAVIKFFASRPDIQKSVWKTRIAPIVSAVAVTGCMYLVLDNFALVTSCPPEVSVALALVPPAAFLGGILMAKRNKTPLVNEAAQV